MEHFYVFVTMLSGEEVKKAIKSLDSVGFALTKDVHLKPHGISMARAAWKALRQDLLKDVSALGYCKGTEQPCGYFRKEKKPLGLLLPTPAFNKPSWHPFWI